MYECVCLYFAFYNANVRIQTQCFLTSHFYTFRQLFPRCIPFAYAVCVCECAHSVFLFHFLHGLIHFLFVEKSYLLTFFPHSFIAALFCIVFSYAVPLPLLFHWCCVPAPAIQQFLFSVFCHVRLNEKAKIALSLARAHRQMHNNSEWEVFVSIFPFRKTRCNRSMRRRCHRRRGKW